MNTKKILWIEDDYYNYKSLFRPIELKGVIIDNALSAAEGFMKAKNWNEYSLIVADIILPLTKDSIVIDEEVKKWEREEDFLGIGLVKWLRNDIKAKCPILILSVIDDPIQTYHLESLKIENSISKKGLLPSVLAETIDSILNID